MIQLLKYWHFDGTMVAFMILIILFYLLLARFKLSGKSAYFFLGILLIIISVASPLHFLGENYLMSAHMTSHVILLLIASPLLVVGLPEIHTKEINRFSHSLVKRPWIPWMVGICMMWFWHIPIVFNHLFNGSNVTAGSEPAFSLIALQNLHQMSLIIAGIVFSWPIIGPVKTARLFPLNAVLYLSGACIFCSILGLLITFAPVGVYAVYVHVQDRFGFLNSIRNINGISMLIDQQVAGLIMWVPGCLIYLSASMFLLMKWFKEKNNAAVFQIEK
jgi:putative membrane protein